MTEAEWRELLFMFYRVLLFGVARSARFCSLIRTSYLDRIFCSWFPINRFFQHFYSDFGASLFLASNSLL